MRKINNKEKWYGKGCKYQIYKFENIGGVEDKSEPILIYCNNTKNTQECECNCNSNLCPISK